jgi:DNA invertase Pin-like site-specific DNA recombinase
VIAPHFPRTLIRPLESRDLPLQTLGAIRELRAYLAELEGATLLKARELGASPADIARELGVSRQAIYNKLRAIQERSREEPVVIPDLEGEPTDRD